MKTKLLSVIIMLALCVTVGGVYASWNYPNEGVTSAFDKTEIDIEMDGATHVGASGELVAQIVDIENGTQVLDQFGFKVENVNDDYVPVLTAKGKISVDYNPAVGTLNPTTKAKCTITIKQTTSTNYAEGILKFKNAYASDVTASGVNYTLVIESETLDGSTSWIINILDYIEITNGAALDTYAKYQEFNTVRQSTDLSIKIEPVTTP